MSGNLRKVAVVPCSGIGKSYGTVSREAAYELCDDLRPAATELVALSRLVMGDEQAEASVRNRPAVAIDGCKLACAAKMLQERGAAVVKEAAVLEAYRRHRDLKPEGIAELNEAGLALARVMAEELTVAVDGLAGLPAGGGKRGPGDA
jgi:uncharacterized metal-binding protein